VKSKSPYSIAKVTPNANAHSRTEVSLGSWSYSHPLVEVVELSKRFIFNDIFRWPEMGLEGLLEEVMK